MASITFFSGDSTDVDCRLKDAVNTVAPTVFKSEIASEWVRIATQPPGVLFQKRAYSPTLRGAASLGGWTPDLLGVLPGVPSPLAATLASGALGAGLGYGTGWVAEKFLPEKWERNRLRRTLAVMGGLAGAAPGALWGYVNLKEHGPAGLVKGWPLHERKTYDTEIPLRQAGPPKVIEQDIELDPLVKEAIANPNPFTDWGPGESGAFPPPIDAEKLVQTIYTPPVSQQLPPETQAATAGLVVGAGHHQTGGEYMPRLVSPLAVGRMSAGMGSGWLSGLLVGKVLGALTGMPDSAQARLRSTGLWAGAIANMVPLAFPNR